MKILLFFLLLIPFFLPACGESESSKPAGKESTTKAVSKIEDDKKSLELGSKSSSKKKSINGEVLRDIVKDGGQAESGKLSLEPGPGNEITGKFDLAGKVFVLRGIKESTNIRLWVTSDAKDPVEKKTGLPIWGGPRKWLRR